MKNKLILISLSFALSLEADSVSFAFYNDFFAGSDGHFTNGGSLRWLEDQEDKNDNRYTKSLLSLAEKLSFPVDSSKHYNAGVNLEQMIITPDNTELESVQYDDFPYAGYLALSTSLFEWDNNNFTEYSVELGIMGKYSGAGFVQTTFHKMIGSSKPEGWDTQLGTLFTLNLLLQHGVKSWEGKLGESLESDWFNHYGATLGNFNTSAFAGSVIRIGQNYVHNFNAHYPYLKDESNLLPSDTLKHGIGWSLSLGFESKVLVYSAILDRGVSEGYDTHKNVLNALIHISESIYYNHHKFRLFYEIPTPYIEETSSINVIGGFEYIYKF
jgi:hypothetical protein